MSIRIHHRMGLTESLLYTTTKITTYANGNISGSGTGFFYLADLDGQGSSLLLVTNKHVLQGADLIEFTLHLADPNVVGKPSGNFDTFQIEMIKPNEHPDANVDLAFIYLTKMINELQSNGREYCFIPVTTGQIPSLEDWESFDAIQEITMVGCPIGLFDEVNNLPIVRRGVTSSDISKNFRGQNHFLVDIACFPGSSGSPLFVVREGQFLDKRSGQYTIAEPQIFFVGVLYSGPTFNTRGEIVLADNPSFEFETLLHLGFVARSTELLAIEEDILRRRSESPTQ
jgi:hypothetical protein